MVSGTRLGKTAFYPGWLKFAKGSVPFLFNWIKKIRFEPIEILVIMGRVLCVTFYTDLYLMAQNGDSEKQKVWSEVKNCAGIDQMKFV